MAEMWYAILAFMLAVFIILSGWDIGAGMLHLIVAKTNAERREVIAAIGPLWTWHEVWLVGAGGVMFVAFPIVLASAFAGYYLALMMLLWALVFRGISIEIAGHINDPLWQSFWDFVFAVSNVVLAILIGAALGNVVRGVPLDATGKFSMALFTNFGVRGRVGLLDWYTLSVAILTLFCLSAHGATFLTFRTTGTVHNRSKPLAAQLWLAAMLLLIIIAAETWYVRPEMFFALFRSPIGWLTATAATAAAISLFIGLRGGSEGLAFAGSCAFIAGLIATAAAGIFPVMLRSTLAPEHSITVHNGATEVHGLTLAAIWWPTSAILAITYGAVVWHYYRGRVHAAQNEH